MKRPGKLTVAAIVAFVIAILAAIASANAQVTQDVPAGRPDAIVDLRTRDGAALVQGAWRYRDVAIVPATNGALDVAPRVDAAEFEEGPWQAIDADSLERRRGPGKLSFAWYRLDVTIPERLGALRTAGSTVVFEIVVDDYAEVWVDGKLPLVLGSTGGAVVRGWNAPNRVVLTRDARPGQHVQLAVFAANAPLSAPPPNYIWVRSATLEFYKDSTLNRTRALGGTVARLDPRVDAIVPRDAMIERVASGFQFTEGPVWHPDGYLLFSDPNANTIYRWTTDGQVSVFRAKSGYAGVDVGEYGQPGANGLTLDRDGRLTIDEHGRRRVVRIEKNGTVTVLADRYVGKRLNSPNDLVYKSDGALYFTDPPFGLPKFFDDARKELPYSGVYRLANGTLQLLTKDLSGPNGLAFSPDERFLYIDDWDVARKVIMRYPVNADGTLGAGSVFLDVTTSEPGEQAWDGLKVDVRGNVYAAGPGGVWILAPDGTHLGTIAAPETPANFAWGDADGRTLYMTARTSVYRIRLNVPGIRSWTTTPNTRSDR